MSTEPNIPNGVPASMNLTNNRQRGRQTDNDRTKSDTSLAYPPMHEDLAPLGSPFILRHEHKFASFASRHDPALQPNYAFHEQQQLGNNQYVSQPHRPQQHINLHNSASYSFPDPQRTIRQAPRPRNVSASSTSTVESSRSGSMMGRVKRVTTAVAGSFFSPTPPDSPEAALRRPQLFPPPPNNAEASEQRLRHRRSSSRGRRPRKSLTQSRHHMREEVIPEVPTQESLLTPPSSPENSFSFNSHTQFYSANAAHLTPRSLHNHTYEIANTYQHQTRHQRTRGWSHPEFLSSANSNPLTHQKHAQLLSPHDSPEFSNYSMHWNAEEGNLLLMPIGPDSADVSLETAFVYPIGATELTKENNLLLLPAGPASADVSLDSVEYYTPEQLACWQEDQMHEVERVEYDVHDAEDDDVTLYWSSPQNSDPQAIDLVRADKGKNVDTSQVSRRKCLGALTLDDFYNFRCSKDG
jgi:hypothetical protein